MFPPVRRVTLVGAQRRVDLILPATIPVGDLLPELIQLGGIDGASDPARWVLTRTAGPDLAPDLTLEDCDVGDGEILLLRHQEAPPLGALTAEAVDVVAEASDEGKGRWSAAATLRLLAGATLASQTAIAIFLLEQREESATPLIAGVLTAACMVLALLLTNRDVLAAQLTAAGGIVVLGAGGAALVAAGDGWPPLVMAAAGTAGVGAAAAALAVPRDRRPFIGLLVGAELIAVAGLAARTFSPDGVAAVLAAAGVAVLPLLPTLALRLAGLPLNAPEVERDRGRTMASQARGQLGWLLAGVTAAVVPAAGLLAFSESGYALLLAPVVGFALILRARAFRFAAEVVPLAAGSIAVLGVWVVSRAINSLQDGSLVIAVATVALPTAAAVAVAVVAAGRVNAPARETMLRRAEALVLLAHIPLVVGQLGLFRIAADLTRRLTE